MAKVELERLSGKWVGEVSTRLDRSPATRKYGLLAPLCWPVWPRFGARRDFPDSLWKGNSPKFAAGFGKWHHALKLANRGRPAEEGESICPATSKTRQGSSRLRLLSTWQPWFLACSSTEGLQLPFCRAP